MKYASNSDNFLSRRIASEIGNWKLSIWSKARNDNIYVLIKLVYVIRNFSKPEQTRQDINDWKESHFTQF